MRQRHFRAWDKRLKKMLDFGAASCGDFYYPWGVQVRHRSGKSSNSTDLIIEDFTSILDVDKNRIFEGDIIAREGHLRVVEFLAGCYIARPLNEIPSIEKLKEFCCGWILNEYNDYTIIGHIHEASEVIIGRLMGNITKKAFNRMKKVLDTLQVRTEK